MLSASLVVAACGDDGAGSGEDATTSSAGSSTATDQGAENIAEPEFRELPTILADETVILDEAAAAKLTNVTPDGILTFASTSSEAAAAQVGDVLVIGRSEAAPDGLLVTVESVDSGGGEFRLATRPAALEEAFDQLAVDMSRPLNAENFLGFGAALPDVSIDEVSFSGVAQPGVGTSGAARFANPCQVYEPSGGIGVHCRVEENFGSDGATAMIEAGFDASMSYEGWFIVEDDLVDIKSAVNLNQKAWFYALGNLDLEFGKTIALPSMSFDVSAFPVVATLTISPYLYANGRVEAEFTFTFDQTCDLAAGGWYKSDRNPEFQSVTGDGCPSPRTTLNYGGKAEFEAGVKIKAGVAVWGGIVDTSMTIKAGPHFWFDFNGVEDDEFTEPAGDIWNLSGCYLLKGKITLNYLFGKDTWGGTLAKGCSTWLEQPNTVPEVVLPVEVTVSDPWEIVSDSGEPIVIEAQEDSTATGPPRLTFSPRVRDSMGQWVSCEWASTRGDTLPSSGPRLSNTFEDPVQILLPNEWPDWPELIPMGDGVPCGGGTVTLNGFGERTITLKIDDGVDALPGTTGWSPVTVSWDVLWGPGEISPDATAQILFPADGSRLDRDEAISLSGTSNPRGSGREYTWTLYYPTHADGSSVVGGIRNTTQAYSIPDPSSWIPSQTPGLTFLNPDAGPCALISEYGRIELKVSAPGNKPYEPDSVVVGFANSGWDADECGVGGGGPIDTTTSTTLVGPSIPPIIPPGIP